jgi:hypothetical protein
MNAFVCDFSKDDINEVSDNSIDFITLIFVLRYFYILLILLKIIIIIIF